MRLIHFTVLLGIAEAILPIRKPHAPTGNGKKLLTFNITAGDEAGALEPSYADIAWSSGGKDGEYVHITGDGSLVLDSVVSSKGETLVSAKDVPGNYWDYWIRADQKKVMWATNYTQQYRYSYFANYVIQDVETGNLEPLVRDQEGDIQYAEFAPRGDRIAFIRRNDLYIREGNSVHRITFDGDANTFNAVPDWVYEEEILGDRYAMWWAPDGKSLAYLSFDETGVGTFSVPYYMDNQKVAPSYPVELELRYPKVGTTNPTVNFNLLDVTTMKSSNVSLENIYSADNLIIGEVSWMTTTHSNVFFRAYNRVQNRYKIVSVQVPSGNSRVVHERDATDGWIDNLFGLQFIGRIKGRKGNWYVDQSDHTGWNHLYLRPVNGGQQISLTSGKWEVTSVLKVDRSRSLIYFTSTERHSTERHLYSVNYATMNKAPLVDDSVAAYWSASFSNKAGYYLLSYYGPDVPYQEIYAVNSTEPIRTLTRNKALVEELECYNLPKIRYFELEHPSGFNFNVMQRLPVNFNSSKKYPVLLTPYGGPGAQEVSKYWQSLNWNAYISSDPDLEYITYTVDGRGTGYRGRVFRSTVNRQLGKLEALDQVWAARKLIERHKFIDSQKIGMWGWSFGGYLTSKVLELDSGVFSLGLITAPVSDWRFYDTMYTERYMGLYKTNKQGYSETAVRNATGFKNVAGGFTIYHGTGDDNVHFQNSAALVDLLMGAKVSPEKMSVVYFTDSDHSISYNNAPTFLYKSLTEKIFKEKIRDTSEKGTSHQWSKKSYISLR